MKKTRLSMIFTLMAAFVLTLGQALAADKPNIVVIMGDDIGQSNISAYTHGLYGTLVKY